jgi:riboflavin synthase
MDKKVGDQVNVESDVLGKYVEKLLDREDRKSKDVTFSFLKEHGFIEGE